MNILESVDEEHINQTLSKAVKEGSSVRSDGLPSYANVDNVGFVHDSHVIGTDHNKRAKVLPWVHVLASNSKRFILLTHHGIKPKYLDRYLAEFTYRYNRRYWQDQLFERLLYSCLTADPTSLPAIST